MPYDDPDATDPSVLVGVSLPGSAETSEEMAWTFAEEFAALGHDEPFILRMFATPTYGGPYRAQQALGEEAIRGIVKESVAFYGAVRFVTRDAGPRRLPMVSTRVDSQGR